ncbi:MerR family DNA-binding transcriptional regulator [Amycolatopsis sp. RTGN1]|uniref:MerR family DNA-binding transcriptional regulator n=1 Tax=Amycolatopsis ponsaeliensis TaxID=2992142 RepID=UPI00254D49CF|nr:MerR family DNA-binding transcriptional regulator [Amycolatopsis sp. RTGN1]
MQASTVHCRLVADRRQGNSDDRDVHDGDDAGAADGQNRNFHGVDGLTIAEAARRTGVSAHTLRYYERAGLVVTRVDRTSGGRRRYAELVGAGRGNEPEQLELLEAHRVRCWLGWLSGRRTFS